MSSGDESGILPKHPDPFQFRKEGLMGKMIGALFLIIFVLIAGLGIGGFKAIKLGEQLLASQQNLVGVVKGLSVSLDEFADAQNNLAAEVAALGRGQAVYVPPPPKKRPYAGGLSDNSTPPRSLQ